MGTGDIIRTILLVEIIIMALLALVYLRQRRLHWSEYCGWGLLALFVPVLGPFLVISKRPGEWDPNFSVRGDFVRVGAFLRRMLPETPKPKKISRLERARQRRKQRNANSTQGEKSPRK